MKKERSDRANIEKQLQAARQNLLDLTMHNRLLNFHTTKARSIKVINEIPSEIYDFLVLQEKTMEFSPTKKTHKIDNKEIKSKQNSGTETSDITEDETSKHWEMPLPNTEVADHHIDRYLQTPLESDVLKKHLFYINQQAQSVLEEQGYTILYLALGFLEKTFSAFFEKTLPS